MARSRKLSVGHRNFLKSATAGAATVAAPTVKSPAQEKTPLRLLETISLPNAVRYRDHFTSDLSYRLFIASEDERVAGCPEYYIHRTACGTSASGGE